MSKQIADAAAVLVSAARDAFPDVPPSQLRFSITADGKELQIMAPGLRWHSFDISSNKAGA